LTGIFWDKQKPVVLLQENRILAGGKNFTGLSSGTTMAICRLCAVHHGFCPAHQFPTGANRSVKNTFKKHVEIPKS
jgi:hypothetical protein